MTTNRHGLTPENVAHLKRGDHAELIFEYNDGASCIVSGPIFTLDSGLMILAGHLVRYSDGSPGDQLLAVVSPKPPKPEPTPEPLPVLDLPEGVELALDGNGELWARRSGNWVSPWTRLTMTSPAAGFAAGDDKAEGWERVAVAPAPPVPDDVIDAAARVIDARIGGGDEAPCEGCYDDARALARAGLLVGTKPEAAPLPEGHVVVKVDDIDLSRFFLESRVDALNTAWGRLREAAGKNDPVF